jgi:hypothetical protein
MNYRKIYQKECGAIPIDENQIPYEIHHKDGNHSNNQIKNLQCLCIDDHFKIHYEQGDFAAAMLILKRKQDYIDGVYDKQLLSQLSKIQNKIRLEKGTHNFLTDEHRTNNRRVQTKLIKEGKHHFCKDQNIRGHKSHLSRSNQWCNLSEEDFFNLLCSYKLFIQRTLRNGKIQNKINSMIIQAINTRYKNIFEKNNVIKKLEKYHNVNATYSWE